VAQEAEGFDDRGFPIITLWVLFNILTWYINHRAVSFYYRGGDGAAATECGQSFQAGNALILGFFFDTSNIRKRFAQGMNCSIALTEWGRGEKGVYCETPEQKPHKIFDQGPAHRSEVPLR
jgi:hypothetical protein